MFFDIEVLAKLFKIDDPEEAARTYADYLNGINTIIIQYLEDEAILAQLPQEKMDEIQEQVDKFESPEQGIDYIYSQLPEAHKEEFKQELKKSLDSYQNKVLHKGLTGMNPQEIQSFLNYLDEYKKEFQDVAQLIEGSDVLNTQVDQTPQEQHTPEQTPTLESLAHTPPTQQQPTEPLTQENNQLVEEPVQLEPTPAPVPESQPQVQTQIPPMPGTSVDRPKPEVAEFSQEQSTQPQIPIQTEISPPERVGPEKPTPELPPLTNLEPNIEAVQATPSISEQQPDKLPEKPLSISPQPAQGTSLPPLPNVEPEQPTGNNARTVEQETQTRELPPLPNLKPEIEPAQTPPTAAEQASEQTQPMAGSAPVYPPLEQFSQPSQTSDQPETTEDGEKPEDQKKPENPPVNFAIT